MDLESSALAPAESPSFSRATVRQVQASDGLRSIVSARVASATALKHRYQVSYFALIFSLPSGATGLEGPGSDLEDGPLFPRLVLARLTPFPLMSIGQGPQDRRGSVVVCSRRSWDQAQDPSGLLSRLRNGFHRVNVLVSDISIVAFTSCTAYTLMCNSEARI